ncbi:MAG TPA: YkvA family protein [Anaerolineae bacterium]|jgi:uncharacterized membrane protein YkvA (DUF1232 family)|nr:YkvA family protein [Anaerolineae bacterium]
MTNDSTSPDKRPASRIDIVRHLKLVWQLLTDGRVSPWVKAVVPALALAYVLLPFDLITDLIPVLGQLDDLAVLLLGMQLFVELCPKGVVKDLMQGGPAVSESSSPEEEIVDASYRVVQEDEA